MSPNETVQDNRLAARSGAELERRSLFKHAGAGIAGAAAVSALSGGSLLASGGRAEAAAAITDADIFNFALNV